jgi:heme-binding protein
VRKFLKISFFVLACLVVVIQFLRPSMTNPPVDRSRDIAAVHPMSSEVASTLQRSCNDCHSNQTVWPWYSNVAPASWVVAHDVNHGRDALNLSEWGAYSADKKQRLMGKMCEDVKDREMPMSQYALVHPRARLNSSDVETLCSWTQQIAPGAKEEGEEGD